MHSSPDLSGEGGWRWRLIEIFLIIFTKKDIVFRPHWKKDPFQRGRLLNFFQSLDLRIFWPLVSKQIRILSVLLGVLKTLTTALISTL